MNPYIFVFSFYSKIRIKTHVMTLNSPINIVTAIAIILKHCYKVVFLFQSFLVITEDLQKCLPVWFRRLSGYFIFMREQITTSFIFWTLLCMPSTLAPDPNRVQSHVCCLFWTNKNNMAVTSIVLSFSLSN